MYIGTLQPTAIHYTHAGSTLPFAPQITPSGSKLWDWNVIYDTAVDLHIELGRSCFVGVLMLSLSSQKAIKKAEVLIDNAVVGAYRARTDAAVGGEIAVSVGAVSDTLILRLYGNLEVLELNSLQILGSYDDQAPLVWPTPKRIAFTDRRLPIGAITANANDADEAFAASFLQECLLERHGITPIENGVCIVFCKTDAPDYAGERYTVAASGNTLTVTAASRLALLYAADTILQVASCDGLPLFDADDKPTKALRGLHMGLPARDSFDFVRRLFRYVLIPLRFNMLIVQFTAAMRFDRHPEINEAWLQAVENAKNGLQPTMPHSEMVARGEVLEKAEIADLLNCAKELGLEVVPEIQSFGHVQYITYAHPELAELVEKDEEVEDTRADDARPVGFYPHCYCPSLQESYDLMYDIIDEIVELVKPTRYVHMGHDEIHHIGLCHRCRKFERADLYVKHVTAMHAYLAKKGLQMMIWSDMIHADPARRYYMPEARDRLPKDILMLDFVWYFRPQEDIEEELLPFGYTLGIGNLYSSHFTRYRSRILKDGIIGGQISFWLHADEIKVGENGKLWDMMYLSNMLWNPETYEENNRRTYTDIIATYVQPILRDELRGTYCANGYRKTDLPLPVNENEHFAPLQKHCPNAMLWTKGAVAVNACYDRLVFAHTTVWNRPIVAWQTGDLVGSYTVAYEDGTAETAEVRYGQNILSYHSTYAQPLPYKYYRHTGYTGTWFADPVLAAKGEDGNDLTVYGYVWENPHPTKKIVSITYTPAADDICGLVVTGITGQSRK